MERLPSDILNLLSREYITTLPDYFNLIKSSKQLSNMVPKQQLICIEPTKREILT